MADDGQQPPLNVRWMRPKSSSAFLELPTAPIPLTNSKDISWLAFTEEESKECEDAWNLLSDAEKKAAADAVAQEKTESDTGDDDEEDEEETVGVSIAQDKLFEVDVRRMQVWMVTIGVFQYSRCTLASSYLLENERTTYQGASRHLVL